MTATVKPVLLLGMSHIQAVSRAMNDADRAQIEVVDLNFSEALFNKRTNALSIEALRALVQRDSAGAVIAPKHVVLSIRGTYHNVFGLIENPIPIAVGDSQAGRIPESQSRHFVPEEMIRAFFASEIERLTCPILDAVVMEFAGAQICHLAPPPPSGDAAHIRSYPGVFRSKIANGVSPIELRRKYYDIHNDIYRTVCLKRNVAFIEVPPVAVASDGSLMRDYWNNDPTHGNERYGRLVLDQLHSIVGATT